MEALQGDRSDREDRKWRAGFTGGDEREGERLHLHLLSKCGQFAYLLEYNMFCMAIHSSCHLHCVKVIFCMGCKKQAGTRDTVSESKHGESGHLR